MCEFVEECREEGRLEGERNGEINSIRLLLNKFTKENIIEFGFNPEIVMQAANGQA